MSDWDAVGAVAVASMMFIAMNVGALRWFFERHERGVIAQMQALKREGTDFSHQVERELLKLKAQLPLEYVRREDWIRFSSTLDAKFDAMRIEMREEIEQIRERLDERLHTF